MKRKFHIHLSKEAPFFSLTVEDFFLCKWNASIAQLAL